MTQSRSVHSCWEVSWVEPVLNVSRGISDSLAQGNNTVVRLEAATPRQQPLNLKSN